MPGDPLWMLFRWTHFVAGITWIGLLYFLNLVNVRAMASLEADVRPKVLPVFLPRVLAWFRHGAWVTVLAGLGMMWIGYWSHGDFGATDSGKTILTGGILGLIMLFNVWGLIWPNQKKIIAATRAGQPVDPAWGRVALYASRTNFSLSFPMLLFMGAAKNYPMDWLAIIFVGFVFGVLGFLVVMAVQRFYASHF
jgi:uncharacterized membrane protein